MAKAAGNNFSNDTDSHNKFQPHLSTGALRIRCSGGFMHWLCLPELIAGSPATAAEKRGDKKKVMANFYKQTIE